jgi:hypothetical protein
VVKRTTEIAKWCKLIAALGVCASVACSKQILPQLTAQLASLDHDHHVSLHASGDGVDLVLTHDHHSFTENDEAEALALSLSEPAHVVHIMTGPATAKQSASLMISNARDVAPYFSTAIVTEWRTLVPPLPLVYSRPPPDEMSILPLRRSTLLLI